VTISRGKSLQSRIFALNCGLLSENCTEINTKTTKKTAKPHSCFKQWRFKQILHRNKYKSLQSRILALKVSILKVRRKNRVKNPQSRILALNCGDFKGGIRESEEKE
jgi:hypothetical protein